MTTQQIAERSEALQNYLSWLRTCEAKLAELEPCDRPALHYNPASDQSTNPRMNGNSLALSGYCKTQVKS